ncbi:MAG: type II toxin-antitoxin system VapC family toxin [Chloroflexota bacterium]|nr:type II toxin-antitoxin system VapC family toxin [Chloroflexota bacterium]MDE2958868.1 type II toxin-antitoxin system VapC family toxin [Chloroflexota bacterium]
MIYLGTSFLIPALVRDTQQDQQVRNWISQGETIAISAVACTEFLCGPLSPRDLSAALRIVEQHLEFTTEHAAIAPRLFNATDRRRRMMVDCMIAATAVADGAQMATVNSGDFDRFTERGLRLA